MGGCSLSLCCFLCLCLCLLLFSGDLLISLLFHPPDDLPDRNCNKCVQCCVDYEGWLEFQHFLYKVRITTTEEVEEQMLGISIKFRTNLTCCQAGRHRASGFYGREVKVLGKSFTEGLFRVSWKSIDYFELNLLNWITNKKSY